MSVSRCGPLRCAIYTRKSTDEGLDRDFNTLDAQREAGEAYVASQKEQGWTVLPKRYDDGGYTGGNIDRPALRRLLSDIQAGQVNCVVVYKVDRLSRSLLDFAGMMETFDRHQVAFVAVTQEFNTATSMGRLMLNVLLSFAQFERELISERTRDKMGAARRKGKWLGSQPVLGYDADREAARLVVNPTEAERVRAIYQLYAQSGSLLETVRQLRQRGWHNKETTTRSGKQRGGRPFNKGTLHFLLNNVTYLGRVRYRNEVFAGEHEAIVPDSLFQQVQSQLRNNRQHAADRRRSTLEDHLRGKIYCGGCQAKMLLMYTTRGTRRYRYYVCSHAQKHGYDQCPTRSVPAGAFERFVLREVQNRIDRARRISRNDLGALIARIRYDGQLGQLGIWFQPGVLQEEPQ